MSSAAPSDRHLYDDPGGELQILRRALDAAGDIVFTTDLQGRFTFVSAAFTRLYGYRSDEVVGKATTAILDSGRHGPDAFAAARRAIASGEDVTNEWVTTTRDGRLLVVQDVSTPVVGDDGITRCLSVQRDVTAPRAERTQLQDELRQSQKMETLGRLTSGIAHDFNNQLTVILGYAELLAVKLSGHTAHAALVEQIRLAGRRSADLTRQLLGFSRRRTLDPQVIDLVQVLRDLEPAMTRLLGDALQLKVAAPRSLGHVRMDRGQFEQVVMNLAVNARDAMPAGGQLRIELLDVPAPNARGASPGACPFVSLHVSDTGDGIAPAALAHIFEPFFTTKPEGMGTGLGLATVRRIVQQAGGAITVESTLGVGTTFAVVLPCADNEAAAAVPEAPKQHVAGTETVLIVEDEPSLRRMVRRSLEERGFRVIEGADGFRAVEAARHHVGRIDLLLSDISMPAMDGPSLAQRLVAMQPDIRIMFVSGVPVDVDADGVSSKVAFLAKPFTPERLVGKVRAVLDARVA